MPIQLRPELRVAEIRTDAETLIIERHGAFPYVHIVRVVGGEPRGFIRVRGDFVPQLIEALIAAAEGGR